MASLSDYLSPGGDSIQTARVRVLLIAGGITLLLIGGYLSSITTVPWIIGIVKILGFLAVLFGVALSGENKLISAIWLKF